MNPMLRTLTVALLLLFSLATAVRAEISFSVSPIRVELSGEPGGTYTDAIEITNEGTEKVRIKVGTQDWYLTEDGTPVFQKGGSQKYSCASWLKINPVDFQLDPKEKKLVRYSAAIPAATVPGGYWASFVFETVPPVEPGKKTKAVAIKGNIASIIYLTVGKATPIAELIDMGFKDGVNGEAIALRLKNGGTVHFRIKGNIRIVGADGKPVQTLEIPDAPVLSGFSRTVSVPLKEKLPKGAYRAIATVETPGAPLMEGEISITRP
jgi:P pilus assembly chaperone PapD